MRAFLATVAITSALHGAPACAADLFTMSFEDFRKAFDQRIREDTPDKSEANFSTTKRCAKKGTTYTCTFSDKGFQSAVTGMKKLNLMNGRFTLKMGLTVETDGGKVARILLIGDRGDPVNLIQFSGTSANIMQLFEPGIIDGEGKSLALAKELGLMRGDADSATGRPVMVIKPYAAITCLVAPSSITTGTVCEWLPRS